MCSEKWERPAKFPFPNVWSTFLAKDVDSDAIVEYRIQDLPIHLFDDAIEHMAVNFLREEPMCKSRNILTTDPVTVREFREFWRKVIYGNRLTIACFKEGSDEIVGMNVLYVAQKSDPKTNLNEYKGECMRAVCGATYHVIDQFDAFDHYKVDRYLAAFGLSVNKKYSGRGIGHQLLNARQFVCKAFDLELTSNMFSSNLAQKCAEKAGFEVNVTISFVDLEKVDSNYKFPNITSTCSTIQSKKF